MTRKNERNVVTLSGFNVKRETAAAILVAFCGEDYWIPKSQIEQWDFDDDIIVMTEWIAEQKGFI